jgi:hypothetical protein
VAEAVTAVQGTGGADGPGGPIPEADRFAVLKNERRRHTFRVLEREGGATTLSRAAELIAGWENGLDPSVLDAQQRKRVYIALYQRHLPRMADVGVIEFERRSGEIRLTEPGRRLWTWCQRVRPGGAGAGATDRWPQLYLAVGVVGVAATAVATMDLVPSVWSTTTILTATVFVALAHASTESTGGER